MSMVSNRWNGRKRLIWLTICDACKRNDVPVHVLHGISSDHIGRDVDVWIDPSCISRTKRAVRETAQSLNLEVFHINSLFGHRFLFFSNDVPTCGVFEFHCVRSLRWFWVDNPQVPEAAPVWKRLVLPLLSRDCEKAKSELLRHPLDENEHDFLLANLSAMRLLSKSECGLFFDAIERCDMEASSKLIRRILISRSWQHPVSVVHFLCRKVISPFWLLAKPCGPVAVVGDAGAADKLKRTVEPRKGILTEVKILDYSRSHSIFLPLKLFLVRIFRQGRQRATILILPPGRRFGSRCLASPVVWNGTGDPVLAFSAAMKKLLHGST